MGDHILLGNTVLKELDIIKDSEYSNKSVKKINKKFYEKFKNYNRLVFYSDELEKKTEIVKSMILGATRTFNKKYRASKLELKDFKPSNYKEFFNKNHIDGYTPSKFGKGLFLNNELICAMIFRRPITSNSIGWEIARFCTKLNTKVHGGASKLLKNWNEGLLMTYSNNRFSNGDVYKKIGFESIKSSNDQSYYYTDFKTRIFRTKCRKLKNPEYKKYTEREQAKLGLFKNKIGHSKPLYRIYDLGQKKWIFHKNKEDNRKVYIYKLTSPKGKHYIGISYDPYHRFYQHTCDKYGSMYKVIQKYGKENIQKKIIYVAFGRQNALYMEQIFIDQYDTYKNGYNQSEGGEGNFGGKKLNEKIILSIKKDIKTLPLSYRELAKKYDVNEVTIRNIQKGNIWSHVGEKYTPKKQSVKQISTKLTIEDVKNIKTMLSNNINRSEIANKFNVTVMTIDAIATGRNWSHVKVDNYTEKTNKKCANKMTREIVEKIRKEYNEGSKQIVLSKKYNISRTTVKNIITYKTWK